MVYYKQVETIINIAGFAKIIINMIVRDDGLSKSIVSNQSLLFTSKFWSLLYYFFSIKYKLFITFYPQTNGQTERQNSTIKAYLRVFVN